MGRVVEGVEGEVGVDVAVAVMKVEVEEEEGVDQGETGEEQGIREVGAIRTLRGLGGMIRRCSGWVGHEREEGGFSKSEET